MNFKLNSKFKSICQIQKHFLYKFCLFIYFLFRKMQQKKNKIKELENNEFNYLRDF